MPRWETGPVDNLPVKTGRIASGLVGQGENAFVLG
jgi:hypothetical protein